MTTIAEPTRGVILGVDTHPEVHVGVVIDHLGRVQGTLSTPTTPAGNRRLVRWAQHHGPVMAAGVDGTGSYGAGLARLLADEGVTVIEVNRPNRQQRRRHGKADPTDAEAAARAVLSGEATARPKAHTGVVESIRVLRVARSSALKARTQAGNQLRDLVITAPEPLRAELRVLSTVKRVARCARFRTADSTDPLEVTRRAMRHLARRWQALNTEIAELAAGDNPERLTSEAAFAALCGVSPVPASSGKTQRHRLSSDPTTHAYAERRTKERLSRRDIVRCLKRYIARQLYPNLHADLTQTRALT